MSSLPIAALIPEIQSALAAHGRLVLQAPPGAGKTTLVPLALLNETWLAGRKILMLEPRRLAARAAAARMAELQGEALGQSIGYRVRFDSQISSRTRIEVVTEGILTRRLQHDPELTDVGLVIFDEFHERSLHADLGLALCLEIRQALRPELGLLVMSATLDGAAVARLLDDAPVLTSQGRSFPVTTHYLPRDPGGPLPETAVGAIVRALAEQAGDLLVFLPGGGEIRRTQALLAIEPVCADAIVCPLYGDLPHAAQQQAIQPDPQGRRKIVLATNIAETSLTIEGVRVVIDSGWARTLRYLPRAGLSRLETVRISADSAEQRAGRAGRLGPGVCYRLWSEATHRNLSPHRAPEILAAELAPLALELAQWGALEANQLAWLDPPPPGALAQARSLLTALDALDEQGRITPEGRRLLAWPLHPRLAHMLERGSALGLGGLACDLAALLEERDILRTATADSDLTGRVEIIHAVRRHGPAAARQHGADPGACARVERAARQWRARLRERQAGTDDLDKIGLLLAFAYPDRIAKRRDDSPLRYRLASGRGARLPEADRLQGQEWLVAAQVDAGTSEGRIYLAAPIAAAELETFFAAHIEAETLVAWDERQEAVVARQKRRFGNLTLSSQPLAKVEPEQQRQAMLAGVRRLGLECLPWTEELRQWQARVALLRCWLPEEGWPDLSDPWLSERLDDWLGPYLDGVSRREQLARLDLANILKNQLGWSLQTRLEQAAPSHLTVPSGSRLRLDYRTGDSPVLAVKLQEMFGLTETPRVADGRVPVTLHLLSPARRPIQVTQDLTSFWERGYPQVRKELKGRYPKHPWPDDPWTAVPTRHTRRRG